MWDVCSTSQWFPGRPASPSWFGHDPVEQNQKSKKQVQKHQPYTCMVTSLVKKVNVSIRKGRGYKKKYIKKISLKKWKRASKQHCGERVGRWVGDGDRWLKHDCTTQERPAHCAASTSRPPFKRHFSLCHSIGNRHFGFEGEKKRKIAPLLSSPRESSCTQSTRCAPLYNSLEEPAQI